MGVGFRRYPAAFGATPLLWWPRSDFTREESELSTKLNSLALRLVPLLPLPRVSERFSAETLRFQKGQQVGVNGIGLGRGHAVRKALVGFQCAILY